MKLLISIGIFYPSQIGGPSNTLYWLAKELAARGFDVTVVASDAGVSSDFAPRNIWNNFDGIKIKYWADTNSFFKMIWFTIREIRNNDVLVLTSFLAKPNLFTALYAMLSGKKIIWSPRGELQVPRGWLKNAYFKVLRFIFGNYVYFHATSADEHEHLFRFMGPNIKVVNVPNYMEIPKKIEVDSEDKYLLYIGRIAKVKALENLILGIALSNEFKKQNYKLYIVGKKGGDYYREIVSLVFENNLQNHIIFKGHVEGEMKQMIFAAAKFTVLVSHSENFGNVIIESLAQGTPALTSKGTPWEILEYNNSGYWIENSPKKIGEAIDKILLLSNVEYLKMRTNAYNICLKEFDVRTNVQKWIDILQIINK